MGFASLQPCFHKFEKLARNFSQSGAIRTITPSCLPSLADDTPKMKVKVKVKMKVDTEAPF
jgi:hypothetical protein